MSIGLFLPGLLYITGCMADIHSGIHIDVGYDPSSFDQLAII